MTTYQVLHHLDSHVILEMEAASVNDVPTSVTGDEALLDWAKDMVANGQSVYQIGTGLKSYNELVRKGGERIPQPSQRTGRGNAVKRAKKMVPRGRPGKRDRLVNEDAPLTVKTPAMETPTVSLGGNWLTVYDVEAALCTVTAIGGLGGRWGEFRRDDAISDPEDRFVVYIGGSRQDLQVRFRLDEHGAPLALHSQFNWSLIGSPTIWPARLRQFWWFHGREPLWLGHRPTMWETHYPRSGECGVVSLGSHQDMGLAEP